MTSPTARAWAFSCAAGVALCFPACRNRGAKSTANRSQKTSGRTTTSEVEDPGKNGKPGRARAPKTTGTGRPAAEVLADSLARCVADLTPRCLFTALDLDASLAAEALRRLAVLSGALRPESIDLGINNPALKRAQVISWIGKILSREKKIRSKRRSLMEKVSFTLLSSPKGPPGGCRGKVDTVTPVSKLLGLDRWPEKNRSIGRKLVAPYDEAAFVSIRCLRMTLSMLLFRLRETGRWITAELAPEIFEATWWRFERLPRTDPFTPPKKLPATARKLFTSCLDCIAKKDPVCLAGYVNVRALAAHTLLQEMLQTSAQKRKLLSRRHGSHRWESGEAVARLNVWRHLLGAVHTSSVNPAKCRLTTVGKDELAITRKQWRSELDPSDMLEPIKWLAGRIRGLRTAKIACPDNTDIYLTGADLSSPDNGWVCVGFLSEARNPRTRKAP